MVGAAVFLFVVFWLWLFTCLFVVGGVVVALSIAWFCRLVVVAVVALSLSLLLLWWLLLLLGIGHRAINNKRVCIVLKMAVLCKIQKPVVLLSVSLVVAVVAVVAVVVVVVVVVVLVVVVVIIVVVVVAVAVVVIDVLVFLVVRISLS